jgi:putative addiction module killer protein
MLLEVRTTEEFDRWFAALRDRAGKVRIQARIDRLSLGNPGQHRNLEGGICEMKIDCGPGYRVYYGDWVASSSYCSAAVTNPLSRLISAKRTASRDNCRRLLWH